MTLRNLRTGGGSAQAGHPEATRRRRGIPRVSFVNS